MKRLILITVCVLVSLVMVSCFTTKGTLTNRITSEWRVEKFERQDANRQNVVIENAGTITFNRNGTGSQAFLGNVVMETQRVENNFTWENTAHTVSIRTSRNQPPKVWIVVESASSRMLWYSTNSEGEVQIMELRKR